MPVGGCASGYKCISAFISVKSAVESKENPKVFNDLCGFPFVLERLENIFLYYFTYLELTENT
jgi:hypothetical protein